MKYTSIIVPKTQRGVAFAVRIQKMCAEAAEAGDITFRSEETEHVTLGDLSKFAEKQGFPPNIARGAWSFLLRDSTLSRNLGGKRHAAELIVRHQVTGRRRDLYLRRRTMAQKKELTKSTNAGTWEIECESLKAAIMMLLDDPPRGPRGMGPQWCMLFEKWIQEL